MTQAVVALERPTWSLMMMGVDAGSDEVLADCVKVGDAGGSGVAHWNPEVDEAREGLLQPLDHILQGLQVLDLHLVLLLADVDILQLVGVLLHATFNYPHELGFVGIESCSGDSAKLSVLADLVWWPRTDGGSIDVHIRLLPHVQPDDLTILGVDRAAHLLQAVLEALGRGLAAAVDLVAWDPTEVRTANNGVRQLLDLLEVVCHGRSLPYLRIVGHVWLSQVAETDWVLACVCRYESRSGRPIPQVLKAGSESRVR